jgi:hypothetical protein
MQEKFEKAKEVGYEYLHAKPPNIGETNLFFVRHANYIRDIESDKAGKLTRLA